MANTIKIKRSTTTATPTSLSEGELAYSESSDNLFIGTSGSNLVKIGGQTDVAKLSGIASGAEVNVQSDFNASSGDAQILNVPDPVITLGGDLSGNVTLTNLASGTLSASITHATSAVTSTKISNWDTAYSWYSTMTTADGNAVIDTVSEIVSAFENHAEGLNLITELDAKLTASSTIDGGSF